MFNRMSLKIKGIPEFYQEGFYKQKQTSDWR